jgi:dipeptidyl aminopeptidase/acylaminoacyl peptidase
MGATTSTIQQHPLLAGNSIYFNRQQTGGVIMKLKNILATAFSVATLFCSGKVDAIQTQSSAETPAPATSATPSASSTSVRKIPSLDFARPKIFGGPIISPDGTQIVYRENIGKATFLSVGKPDSANLFSDKSVRRFAMPEKQTLNWYRWASNNRLLVSIAGSAKLFGEDWQVSQLLMIDLATSQVTKLGGKDQGLEGDDLLYTDPNGEFILLAIAKSVFDYPGVYRVDLATNKSEIIVKPQSDIAEWIADNSGVVRAGFAYSGTSTRIFYRKAEGEKFERIAKINDNADEKDFESSLFDVARIASGRDEGFVLSNAETGRFALYRFNYLTREKGEKIFGHDENDVTGYELNDAGNEIESISYTDSRDRIIWRDPVMKKHHERLEKALPGQEIWIQSTSRDKKRMIVYTTSSTDPGSYYLFEPAAKRLYRFAGINDSIVPNELSETKYIRYNARDGQSIPAYLTLPKNRSPQKLPLIILPHGGPYNIRDTLDYSGEVQFLVNRGYAVLQPNFRGSGSYGEEFYKMGEGQIGRAMQDDLDDGMDWLVKEGIADPDRVCLVGASYGGYAALWGVIRNPERYRCAASFAGVTDWNAQLKYDRRFFSSRYSRKWRDKVRGDAEFDLDTVSPVKLAGKLNRPVLLTHGDEDSNVPFSQYKSFLAATSKAGKSIESKVYTGEGHGFADYKNEQDWFDRLEAFLMKHNPSN